MRRTQPQPNYGYSMPYPTSFNVDPKNPPRQFFLGLDLGQAKDYTALAIIDRTQDVKGDEHKLDCVHLKRWPLRTPYPEIVADMLGIIEKLPTEGREKPVLAIDNTGCGAPVSDLFRRERFNAEFRPVQIVAGSTVSKEGGVTRVPKRDLVGVVQVALQNRRLQIAAGLPDAAVLTSELQNFQVKITDAANDTYGAWRTGTHDDLVLALALAVWMAGRPIFRPWEQWPESISKRSRGGID